MYSISKTKGNDCPWRTWSCFQYPHMYPQTPTHPHPSTCTIRWSRSFRRTSDEAASQSEKDVRSCIPGSDTAPLRYRSEASLSSSPQNPSSPLSCKDHSSLYPPIDIPPTYFILLYSNDYPLFSILPDHKYKQSDHKYQQIIYFSVFLQQKKIKRTITMYPSDTSCERAIKLYCDGTIHHKSRPDCGSISGVVLANYKNSKLWLSQKIQRGCIFKHHKIKKEQ